MPDKTTSVYIHFPWCIRKCPYCDFATRAAAQAQMPLAEYTQAVLKEIALRAPTWADYALTSIFFGGGTPSLWLDGGVAKIIAALKEAFVDAPVDLEITAECNPQSFGHDAAKVLHASGVNRISLGVQSLQQQHLRFLQRLHDPQSAIRALELASKTFERVSADFIFGMPDHQPKELERDLKRAISTGIEHASIYALTIEERTRFGELHRLGKLRVAGDDGYADLYQCARATMTAHGFEQYEISNYARNKGARSIHNAHYWRSGLYVGLGAGAVGTRATDGQTITRYTHPPDPYAYMRKIEAAETLNDLYASVEGEQEMLNEHTLFREALMLGLRTEAGVAASDFFVDLPAPFDRQRKTNLDKHILLGNIIHEADHLRVPKDRWFTLDSITADFF